MPPLESQNSIDVAGGEQWIAISATMRQVMEQVRRAALEPVHVMLCGEPGSGREFIARKIHAYAYPAARPFVKVDCSKSSAHDLEVDLFGVRGLSGGAERREERRALERVAPTGLLCQSRGGTLFLQHLADLPARAQARLGRVLRDGEAVMMSDATPTELNVRIITAADVSPEAAIADGRIQADLYKRLSAFRLDVPPLRDRREDIPDLAAHMLAVRCGGNGPSKQLSDAARSMLAALPWRGNGNELRRLMETLVARVPTQIIGLDDLLANVRLDGRATWFAVGGSLRDARKRFESEYIAAVLAQHHWRIPEAAKTLGIQRSNLYRKMRSLNLKPGARRRGDSQI
jgi:two-component system nitrogen regulation response regulator NtrX